MADIKARKEAARKARAEANKAKAPARMYSLQNNSNNYKQPQPQLHQTSALNVIQPNKQTTTNN